MPSILRSHRSMSNTGYHANGKPNWWARVGTGKSAEFLTIPYVRGDSKLECEVDVEPGTTVYIGAGKGSHKTIRETVKTEAIETDEPVATPAPIPIPSAEANASPVVPTTRKSQSPKQEQQAAREAAKPIALPAFHQYRGVDGVIRDLDFTSLMAKSPTVDQLIASPFRATAEYLRKVGYSDEVITGDYLKSAEVKSKVEEKNKDPFVASLQGTVEDRVHLERYRARIGGASREDAMAITSQNVDEVITSRASGKDIKAAKLAKLKELKENTEPVKVEAKPVVNSVGIEVTKTDGGRFNIFGHPVTGLFRYCGSAGWSHDDAMAMLKSLGINGEVSESTARIQMAAGKKGGDCGGRGPIPTLTPEQIAKLDATKGIKVVTGSTLSTSPVVKSNVAKIEAETNAKRAKSKKVDAQVASDEAALDAKAGRKNGEAKF